MKKLLILLSIGIQSITFAQPKQPELVEHKSIAIEEEPKVELVEVNFESAIVTSFKTGNSTKIASYFGDNIDLSIVEVENLYSKSQAEQILKNFFLKHSPTDFVVIHKGKSGSSEYFIGELRTKDGVFRVTINSKVANGGNSITSLTIENS